MAICQGTSHIFHQPDYILHGNETATFLIVFQQIVSIHIIHLHSRSLVLQQWSADMDDIGVISISDTKKQSAFLKETLICLILLTTGNEHIHDTHSPYIAQFIMTHLVDSCVSTLTYLIKQSIFFKKCHIVFNLGPIL